MYLASWPRSCAASGHVQWCEKRHSSPLASTKVRRAVNQLARNRSTAADYCFGNVRPHVNLRSTPPPGGSLDGRVVLIIQGSWRVARDLADAFEAKGAQVVLAGDAPRSMPRRSSSTTFWHVPGERLKALL